MNEKEILFELIQEINIYCKRVDDVLRKVIYLYFVQPNSKQHFL